MWKASLHRWGRRFVTDDQGRLSMPHLEPGRYLIKLSDPPVGTALVSFLHVGDTDEEHEAVFPSRRRSSWTRAANSRGSAEVN